MIALPFSADAPIETAVSFDNATRTSRLRLQTTVANRRVRSIDGGHLRVGLIGDPFPGLLGGFPQDSIVCWIGESDGLRRNRPAWPKRLTHFLYINIDTASFEQELRKDLAANPISESKLFNWWTTVWENAADRAILEAMHPDLDDRYIHLVMQGRDSYFFRDGGVEIGDANGVSPMGTDFVTLDIMLVAAGGIETPITLFQDLPEVFDAVVPAPSPNPIKAHPITKAVLQAPSQVRHNADRGNFHNSLFSGRYVYPREYTNPIRRNSPDSHEYEPGIDYTCVVGCSEFQPPLLPVVVNGHNPEYLNWLSVNVWFYDVRTIDRTHVPPLPADLNLFPITTVRQTINMRAINKPRADVRAIVIHDTDNNDTPRSGPHGWVVNKLADIVAEPRKRDAIGAHFLVSRNGDVSQFADLLEHVNHARKDHNATAIGIEVANTTEWSRSSYSGDMRAFLRLAPFPGKDPVDYELRIPPEHCLLSLWSLVEWLTNKRSPLAIPRVFPQLDPRYWTRAEVDSLPSWFREPLIGSPFDQLTTRWAGLALPGADGTAAGTRYWNVHISGHGNRMIDEGFPGIFSHGVIWKHKLDGIYTMLYLWRRAKGDLHEAAISNALSIIQSPSERIGRSWFVPILYNDATGMEPPPPLPPLIPTQIG